MDFVVIVHKYIAAILNISTKLDFFRENSVTFWVSYNYIYIRY